MTKCKITINNVKTFSDQGDAKFYLRDIVEAGCLFIHSYIDGDKTKIEINETTYYQTQREGKIALKKFIDAGILLLEVSRWDGK